MRAQELFGYLSPCEQMIKPNGMGKSTLANVSFLELHRLSGLCLRTMNFQYSYHLLERALSIARQTKLLVALALKTLYTILAFVHGYESLKRKLSWAHAERAAHKNTSKTHYES